jgi:hypothetical protein
VNEETPQEEPLFVPEEEPPLKVGDPPKETQWETPEPSED